MSLKSAKKTVFYPAICALLSLQAAISAMPCLAQTEYDSNLVQAAEQEAQYKAQIEQERAQLGPTKEAYEKQLEKLTLSGGIAKHGSDLKIKKQISSLQYWLQKENQREAQEEASLNNLDGWTKYWKSKQDSVLRTQAWNQEQIELDNRAAQKRALEEESAAARQARMDADTAYWDGINNPGYGYGGYGHRYHNYFGHTPTIHVSHSSGGHASHAARGR